MTANPDPKIIPFGKYKGRLVDGVLVDDPNYLQWLAAQDWFRAKFNILHQVIINRGAEPEETPDHNAMQVKFLDMISVSASCAISNRIALCRLPAVLRQADESEQK